MAWSLILLTRRLKKMAACSERVEMSSNFYGWIGKHIRVDLTK